MGSGRRLWSLGTGTRVRRWSLGVMARYWSCEGVIMYIGIRKIICRCLRLSAKAQDFRLFALSAGSGGLWAPDCY